MYVTRRKRLTVLGPFSNDGNCVNKKPSILYSEENPGSRAATKAQQVMVLDGGDCPYTLIRWLVAPVTTWLPGIA